MKNLTAHFQDMTRSFESVVSVFDEIETAAIQGHVVIQIATDPGIIFNQLGYSVTESFDRWIISWADPHKSFTKYHESKSAFKMRLLGSQYREIRDFCVMAESEAFEAAMAGFKEYKKPIPNRIDRANLRNYITRLYPTDDIIIVKDDLVINWDPDKGYL